jgi:hypothetical protein
MNLKLLTVSGELVDLPPSPEASGRRKHVLSLVRCRLRWVPEDDLISGRILSEDTELPASFAEAATLCSIDGQGNPVALPVPYDCATAAYVLAVHRGSPEWRPYRE